MAKRKAVTKQVIDFTAGMVTEVLYAVFLAAGAFLITLLVTRWL
ncbi:MAG: hypothetical protein QME41_04275 [Actinomycetota bacterium]|nr:hypothetical protein [Actinomycetota bacterium]